MDKNQLSVDMAGFDAADINVRETEKQGETLLCSTIWFFSSTWSFPGKKQLAAEKMKSVRVKDEETG